MIKFIKNLFVFVLIVSIVTMAVNFVYVKQRGPDPDRTNKFASIPDKVQICNFGSSHGLDGFNYEDLEDEYSCFNFALESQTLSYDYRLFQHYNDHIEDGAVVFIPVSYSQLFGIEDRDTLLSKNRRYYSILPASLIKEYDYKTDIYVKYLPVLATNTGSLIKTLLGKATIFNDTTWQSVTTETAASKSAKTRYNDHVGGERFYNDDGDRIENQEAIDALYALVKGCQKRGAVPILITTPFLHEYTDEVKENSPDFYDQFYSIINQVVRDTGVEYYDYAFDERFINNYSWFMNIDHLNKEGAKRFVDILMQEIVYEKGYF